MCETNSGVSLEDSPFESDAVDWKDLDNTAGLYGSERWHTLQAQDPRFSVRLLLARGENGRVLGLLPAWAPKLNGVDAYGRKLLEPCRLSPRQVVYLGCIGSYRASGSYLKTLSADERSYITTLLFEFARQYAEGMDRRAVIAYSQDPAVPADYERFELGAEALLRLPRGYQGWFDGLSKNRRTSVRREIRAFEGDGYRLVSRPLESVVPRVSELLANTQRKYGRNAQQRTLARHLDKIAAVYGEDAVVLCAERGGTIDGFALLLTEGTSISLRAAGFEGISRSFLYFNTAIYGALRYADTHGATELHLGTGSLAAKVSRGAAAEPLYLDVASV